mmetsp:Transcript_17144/g.25991  ORF Transcript_17144/g.25991 Transcript_17144/m.25991 type:complete len:348 (+) Transcript_17144:343-1386(+)
MTSPASQKEEQPVQPSPNDVLLGRASHIYNHPGNIRYRCIIGSNQRKYHACKTRLDKMIFIRQITKEILDGDVKFWKIDKKSGKWKEVDFRSVQDKVSHALRDSQNGVGPYEDDTSGYGNGHQDPIKSSSATLVPTALAIEPRRMISQLQQQIQEKKQQQIGIQRNIARSALEQRDLNLRLTSMAAATAYSRAALGGPRDAIQQCLPLSLLGGLPQLGGLPSNLRQNQGLTASSLWSSEPLNQSNTLSQQLTEDDILYHTLRQREASLQFPAPPSANRPPSFTSYQNQRVYGNRYLKKNLDCQLGDNLDINYIENALQKLSSQQEAEVFAVLFDLNALLTVITRLAI